MRATRGDHFRARYRDLVARMKALAEEDGDVFLPNPEPSGPVDYVFICMEPSLGGRPPEHVEEMVRAGSRNFVNSVEDFILHFCINRYLSQSGETYHITDISKGAMLVKRAGQARDERYARWYRLLETEMELVAKEGAHVFAVGRSVADLLHQRRFPGPFTRILHYSGQATPARAACVVGHEDEFEQFKSSVAMEDVAETAEHVLNDSVPAGLHRATLERLLRSELTESRKELIFCYKLAFEEPAVGYS